MSREQQIKRWDDSLPFQVIEFEYDLRTQIKHQGIIVEPPIFEIWHELDCHRYVPKYYTASFYEKTKLIAKALWSRLQRHYRVNSETTAEAKEEHGES